jgi:hypothetical protein
MLHVLHVSQLQPPLLLLLVCLQAQAKFLPPAVFQCDKPAGPPVYVLHVLQVYQLQLPLLLLLLLLVLLLLVLFQCRRRPSSCPPQCSSLKPALAPACVLHVLLSCVSTAAAAAAAAVLAGAGQVPATRSVPV